MNETYLLGAGNAIGVSTNGKANAEDGWCLCDGWPQVVGLSQLITVCTTSIEGPVADGIPVEHASSTVMTHGHPTKE